MKTPLLLGALLVCAAPLCAQPNATAPRLTNDLPFPLVAPAKVSQLAAPQSLVLDLKDATLGAALDELKKQSGVEFGTSQLNYDDQLDTKLSVKLNTPSFNKAFQQIMAAAGLKASLQDWGGDGALQVIEDEEGAARKPQTSGSGLFEIDLSSVDVNSNKSVDLSDFKTPQRDESNSLNVNLALQSDRRLSLVGTPQTRVTRAEDDKGRSLLPTPDADDPNASQVNRYNFYGDASWQQKTARLTLNPPARDAKTLAHLEGVVIYAVVTKSEKWEVPDLLAAPQWTRTFTDPEGTVALKIAATSDAAQGDAQNAEGGLQVQIEATSSSYDEYSENVGYPLSQAEALMATIRIVDGNGTVYRNNGLRADGGPTMKITATFLPEDDGQDEADRPQPKAPYKLTLNAPIEVVQTEVPFSFDNVPLP